MRLPENANYAEKVDRVLLLSDAVESSGPPNGKCYACGESTDLDGEECAAATLCVDCDAELEELSEEIES